jgi:hypothetical protein
MSDPFATLGLPDDADEHQVRAARRRLAKERHPDTGGDAADMTALNAATNDALDAIARRTSPPPASGPTDHGRPAQRSPDGSWVGAERVVTDVPSFTVEALPVEAFEALLVVASWIGEVLDDDPPYRLEVLLREPAECWCALDLVPDAGASTVSLQVATIGGRPAPGVEAVRDVWITHLNQLDWD